MAQSVCFSVVKVTEGPQSSCVPTTPVPGPLPLFTLPSALTAPAVLSAVHYTFASPQTPRLKPSPAPHHPIPWDAI